MSEDSKPIYCIPGDRLMRSDDKVTGGDGTYTKGGFVYASLAGIVKQTQNEDDNKTIEVIYGNEKLHKMPSLGSIVTCKVLNISPLNVRCAIHCIEDCVLKQPFRGIIRKEDVRALDKDRVEIHKCFRTGDVILAKVLSFGENAFLLTTAENELGVVVAQSESGMAMVPISWTEMMCPKTFTKEQRKVAKIVSETHTHT